MTQVANLFDPPELSFPVRGKRLFWLRVGVLFSFLVLGAEMSGVAISAEVNPSDLKLSCERNYRDIYAVEAKLHFKDGVLVGAFWSTATDKGHACGVVYGTFLDKDAQKELFSANPGEDRGDWYLLEPPNGFCVVRIHRTKTQFTLSEAYPGACKKHCGANGTLTPTTIDSRNAKCGLPRLDK